MLLMAAAKADHCSATRSLALQELNCDIALTGHERRSVHSGETENASETETETATVTMTDDTGMRPG